MKPIKITKYLPITWPFGAEGESHKLFKDAIAHLNSLSEINLVSPLFSGKVSLKKINKIPKRYASHHFGERPEFYKKFRKSWLKVSLSSSLETVDEFEVFDQNNKKIDLSVQKLKSSKISALSDDLDKTVFLLVQAMNIARPGCMRIESGIDVVDGRITKSAAIYHSLFDAVDYCVSLGWPKFTPLNFAATWDWATHQIGFCTGKSQTNVGRALNAYSYLFDSKLHDPIGHSLFWSMVGLEALYTKSGAGVMQDMLEKGKILMGEEGAYEKIIKNLYNQRSRILHGQKNIPNQVNDFDVDNTETSLEFYRTEMIAMGMLIKSLQYLAAKNISELRFNTSVLT